jgi:hypothetical protein
MFQLSYQLVTYQVSFRSGKLFQNTTVWKLGTKICHKMTDNSALTTLVT